MSLTDLRSPHVSRGLTLRKPAVESSGGIVTAQNRQAAQIGADILAAGGSAVDAAIATSFALGVLEPWMSGIGGVGALLVRPEGGAVTAIDAGAVAPGALDPEDFPLVEGKDGDLFGWPNVLEDRNVIGARSICVPGLLRGLEAAHARFGKLPWADLVAPAIALARAGLVVDAQVTAWIAQEMSRLRRDPVTAAWFLPEGLPPAAPAAVAGRVRHLANPALAETLAIIAAEGPGALYEGPLAEALAADVQAAGGYLSTTDLSGFAARVTPSKTERFRDRDVHFVPVLNGGVTVALALRHFGETPAEGTAVPGPEAVLRSAHALAQAWAHRFSELGDGAEHTLPSCTSHLSVVDRDGLCVSLTQTLLSLFGSAVVSPATGILLNNGVNWFDPRPGRVNCITPGAKALANYAPMMLTGPEETVAIGGSGGRKILPAIYQALIHMVDHGHGLEDAIAAPRYDLSAPPTVVADPRLGRDTIEALAAAYPVVLADREMHPNSYTTLGATSRKNGRNFGMAEPWHPTAEAVAEGSDALSLPATRGEI
ncbi:gamma-glutamyltransferase [Pseudooceanicola sp. CBS1P-1]|uniref:Gamma-glutamyltransferase n=1 Tax=Pseudooceanicola albus TaxID=2692189 RepID=A0A6L7FZY9_9RHOB|nr:MULTISPECIES: gamma-glutamyltransferase [Pseudooceanicola]MBT9383519.1 gamma-glutamyltransferase [Pseudooceanicola endophyticus]MXN17375.1 gamma-glutamyltransferase [Pseudooceanicola albus]